MTPQEEHHTKLRKMAELYIDVVTGLFETIQSAGFTVEQVREEVAKLDAMVEPGSPTWQGYPHREATE